MDILKLESKIWNYFSLPKVVEEFLINISKAVGTAFPNFVLKMKMELMHGDQLLKTIGRSKGVTHVDKYIKLDYHTSYHSLTAYRLQDGFSMVKHRCSFTLNVTGHRLNPAKNKLYEFLFPHPDSTIQLNIKEVDHTVGCEQLYGGFWFSPGLDFKLITCRGTQIELLSIVVDESVMHAFMNTGKDDFVKQLLNKKKEFFYQGECSTRVANDLRRIFEHADFDLAGMMELEGLTKITVARFLQSIIAREMNDSGRKIDSIEMDRALNVKRKIQENLNVKPSLSSLAKELGTNRVTLQKGFKALFGKSIYQYYLDARLEEAKTLLESGKYTVSEVSDMLGYMSLGQFSLSFQKKHGSNPSTYKTPK